MTTSLGGRIPSGKSGQEFLQDLYWVAVDRVSPYQMVKERVGIHANTLEIQDGSETRKFSLSNYDRVLVVGAGKASAPMACAIEEIFEGQVDNFEGVVSVKYGHTVPTQRIRLIEAGHPVPDEQSFLAGDEIALSLKTANKHTMVINLISGGGSALLARPWPGLEYTQLQEMTQTLLDCGANIHEMNVLRKHTSGIKGGRLAELAYPGRLVNIILSDVVGDDLESIASGPGVPDPSSFDDLWNIINKYELDRQLPQEIVSHFQKGLHDSSLETPKPGATCFQNVTTVLLGNNRVALEAVARHTSDRVESLILSSRIVGEAREVAKVFAAIALDPPRKNLLILAGGETTVHIHGKGLGGRNQELALSYLDTVLRSKMVPQAFFLAAGSDGNDGPTDAAGVIIGHDDVSRLQQGPAPVSYLATNNSYQYFSEQGLLYKPGPTNTNVCDFYFLYIPG